MLLGGLGDDLLTVRLGGSAWHSATGGEGRDSFVLAGIGADAEFRAPMALVVIGGLITSTLLSLVVVPVVYTVVDDFGAWALRLWRRRPADPVAAPALSPGE